MNITGFCRTDHLQVPWSVLDYQLHLYNRISPSWPPVPEIDLKPSQGTTETTLGLTSIVSPLLAHSPSLPVSKVLTIVPRTFLSVTVLRGTKVNLVRHPILAAGSNQGTN